MSSVSTYAAGLLNVPSPLLFNYPALATPHGIVLKPGQRIAAYVRSTGLQQGDDLFAMSGNLVPSINEGLKRCRAGQNDVVAVLPGHAETITTASGSWANTVAGAQVIGLGPLGTSTSPTVTIAGSNAVALNAADMLVAGLTIRSSIAIVSAVIVMASGCTVAGNSIIVAGTSSPVINVFPSGGTTGVSIVGNLITADSGAQFMIAFGGVSAHTNFLVAGNIGRQVSTSAGVAGGIVSVASVAGSSGQIVHNFHKTATTGTAGVGVVSIGAACIATVGNHENYGCDESAAGALLATGA